MSREAVAAPPSPYKGLAPFDDSELDALLFFGREREIEVIAANLMASRLTILYGPSGVGKTSLLRAGVAHRLRTAHDAVVAVVSSWTGDPVEEVLDAAAEAAGTDVPRNRSLADALTVLTRRLDADVYVVLDQFEEYFLYHENERGPRTLAHELPELLRRAGLRVNVLLGIREDSLAQLDPFKTRIPNLFANSLRLERLDRDAGRTAIVGPIERYNELVPEPAGVAVDPDLVEALLNQVAVGRVDLGQAGRGTVDEREDVDRIEAPYLQLVLERLWEVETARGSRRLRAGTLNELGGAAQIVEDHLDRAMAALSEEQKDAAAAMYNHLVTPSGTKIAHRAGDLAGYAAVDEDETQRVLNRLVQERIVRASENGAGGARYEIFHDVLADAVLAWRARHEADRRLDAERLAAQRRHRRLVILAGGALVAIAVLAALAAFAFVQRHDARRQARHARAQELAALAESQGPVDPERGLAFALGAAEQERTAAVADVLRRTLASLRIEAVLPAGAPVSSVAASSTGGLSLLAGADGVRLFNARSGKPVRRLTSLPTTSAVFTRNGSAVVVGGSDGFVRLWSTQTFRLDAKARAGGPVTSVVVSPDGRFFATTTATGITRIWRMSSASLWRGFRQPGAVESTSFSSDGKLLVTAGADRIARVFDLRSRHLVRRLVQPSRVTVARFAPVGALLATGAPDRIVRIWNAETGRLVHALQGHRGPILDVAFSPDGRLLASASADESARVWDVRNGGLVAPLLGHENFVTRAIFSPDGKYVATASVDRVARLFDAQSGNLTATFVGHRDSVTNLAFSRDGTRLVTGSRDGTGRMWDARPRRDLVPLRGAGGKVTSLAFSSDDRTLSATHGRNVAVWRVGVPGPVREFASGSGAVATTLSSDGRLVAAAARDGTIHVWPAQGTRQTPTIQAGGRVTSLALSTDDRELAAAVDGTGKIWKLSDGSLVESVRMRHGRIATVSLSGDASWLVATSGKVAEIWDVHSGKVKQRFVGHTKPLTSASLSPDGRLLVTTSFDHDARIWDAESGKPRWLLRGKADYAVVNDAAFSSDGRWVVTAGPGSAGIWNVDTGRLLFFLHADEPLLNAVEFSHQDWRIATGGALKGMVETYDCSLCGRIDDLIALARARLAAIRRG
jgi:WD40 repeat protein